MVSDKYVMLYVGMEFTSQWFEGVVEVLNIDAPKNELLVVISRPMGYHQEDWNLEHTITGFKNGDYIRK